jgi:spore coat protein A
VVNGKVWPYLNVAKGMYRFRILNACNSRFLTLSLSNGQAIVQIGTDGGLLPEPVALSEVTLGPAERADVVIDFAASAAGTEIILTNSAPSPFPGSRGVGVVPNVMKFIVTKERGHTQELPAALRSLVPLEEVIAQRHREFTLQPQPESCAGFQWLINGLHWDQVSEFIGNTDAEVWSFINPSGISHPMHIHLVQFQVLDRQPFQVIDDEIVPTGPPVAPPANEKGWKDTVSAHPSEITRIIARFDGYGYFGGFAYHCHILEHEDHEMMRQYFLIGGCRADCAEMYEGENAIDVLDLLELLGQWDQNGSCDIDRDGTVNVSDLLAMLTQWGYCPFF